MGTGLENRVAFGRRADGQVVPLAVDAGGQLYVAGVSSEVGVAPGVGNVSAPGDNAAATITLGAIGGRHCIGGVAWSYDDDPTGGNLQITVNGLIVFSVDITSGGPGFIPFEPPMMAPAGTPVVITLAAGGAGIAGKVNILSYWTE